MPISKERFKAVYKEVQKNLAKDPNYYNTNIPSSSQNEGSGEKPQASAATPPADVSKPVPIPMPKVSVNTPKSSLDIVTDLSNRELLGGDMPNEIRQQPMVQNMVNFAQQKAEKVKLLEAQAKKKQDEVDALSYEVDYATKIANKENPSGKILWSSKLFEVGKDIIDFKENLGKRITDYVDNATNIYDKETEGKDLGVIDKLKEGVSALENAYSRNDKALRTAQTELNYTKGLIKLEKGGISPEDLTFEKYVNLKNKDLSEDYLNIKKRQTTIEDDDDEMSKTIKQRYALKYINEDMQEYQSFISMLADVRKKELPAGTIEQIDEQRKNIEKYSVTLSEAKAQYDNLKQQISAAKSQKDRYNIINSNRDFIDEYERNINDYNRLIQSYNTAINNPNVKDYFELINKYQESIDEKKNIMAKLNLGVKDDEMVQAELEDLDNRFKVNSGYSKLLENITKKSTTAAIKFIGIIPEITEFININTINNKNISELKDIWDMKIDDMERMSSPTKYKRDIYKQKYVEIANDRKLLLDDANTVTGVRDNEYNPISENEEAQLIKKYNETPEQYEVKRDNDFSVYTLLDKSTPTALDMLAMVYGGKMLSEIAFAPLAARVKNSSVASFLTGEGESVAKSTLGTDIAIG